ncbi:S-layer homology domain-containing protein [Paraburkholderia sp. RL17-368-BIF-A]|uniref:S-layer homology domain-containing protein n=1 Tax=Paraburkholderia sp. RL17-368-BIF-A TaxID=3031628 RepID=UPI0038CA931B
MKSNKFVLGALTLAVMTPAIVIPMTQYAEVTPAFASEKVAFSKIFSDVSKNSDYYETIHQMAEKGIINGYEDGTFRPLEKISRQHAAVLINSATDLPKTLPFKAFKDVPQSHYYYDQIKAVQMAGILEADGKGNFNGAKAITRGEMAKALAIAFDLEVKADYSFKDVPDSNEYAEYIKALYSNGVAAGYEDGTFKPNESLSRVHYALFMNKAMNLDPNFEAVPIEKEEIEETNLEQLIEEITRDNVPLPNGYTDAYQLKEEQIAKAKEIQIKEKHTITLNFTVSKSTLDLMKEPIYEWLKENAEVLRISVEELVSNIHQVRETGEVYNGGHYTLYFDWTKRSINTTLRDTTFLK